MFLFVALLPALLIWKAQNLAFPLIVLAFYTLMASIYTTNIQMTSYLPLNLKKDGKVSTAAGTIDCSFYIGAAIAGPLIGIASEIFSWNGIFGGILCIGMTALIPAFLLLIRSKSENDAFTP